MTLTFGELSASQILVGKIGLCRAAVKGNGFLLSALLEYLHEKKMITVPVAGNNDCVILRAAH